MRDHDDDESDRVWDDPDLLGDEDDDDHQENVAFVRGIRLGRALGKGYAEHCRPPWWRRLAYSLMIWGGGFAGGCISTWWFMGGRFW